jgi:hypothetical protein
MGTRRPQNACASQVQPPQSGRQTQEFFGRFVSSPVNRDQSPQHNAAISIISSFDFHLARAH